MATYSAEQIAAVAQQVGFSGQQLVDAVAVALAESSGQVEVVNSSGNTGLWQIGPKGTVNDAGTGLSENDLKNPMANAQAAYLLSNGGRNWSKWSTWPGAADGQMSEAQKGVSALATDSKSKNWWDYVFGGPPGLQSPYMQVTGNPNPGYQAVDAVQSTLDVGTEVSRLADDAGKAAKWVSSPKNWLRIAYVWVGGTMVLVGLGIVAKPAIMGGTKVAGKAAKIAAVG